MVETMLLFLILPNMACVIQLLKIPTNQTEIIIYRDKKMKRKKRKFAINVMSLAVIPILILGMFVIFITSSLIYTALKGEVANNLEDLARVSYQDFDMQYPGDYYLNNNHLYKGTEDIQNDFNLVDLIKNNTGVDATLFYQDKRILTTIRQEDGKRVVDTIAPDEVIETVLNNDKEFFSDSVVINDSSYFGFYMPVKNTDQHVVGMLFMGRPRADVMNYIMHNIYLVSLSIVTIMIIAIIVSYYYSKKTIFALNTTKHFLGAVANGDLTTEIDPYVLQRHDEIGDMGRFAVMMKESLSDLVGKDPLTGLHNRHSCDVVLASLIQRVKQKNTSFAVAMGDVDFFKYVNDTYGHQAGDETLRQLAKVISTHMEHLGFVFRWGGEEYVLIYEDMDRYQAFKHLEILQEQIDQESIYWKDDKVKITMTFGLADSNEYNDLDELINLIDDNLYRGKKEGRNRIVFNTLK